MYEPQNLQSTGGATSGKRTNLSMFDRKVSEADTYLQLIIEQANKIEQKIENIEDSEERERYNNLKDQANVGL
jgi:hypothetical protein